MMTPLPLAEFAPAMLGPAARTTGFAELAVKRPGSGAFPGDVRDQPGADPSG